MEKPNIGHVTTERVSIDKLKPAEYNPRDITDKAREGLSNSIEAFGLLQPIIWNKQTGNVVGGHQRLYNIISKGALETDVIVVDFSLAKEKAANIALNHQGISGHYNNDQLHELLSEIDEDFKYNLNFEELELDLPPLPESESDTSKEQKEVDVYHNINVKIPYDREYLINEVHEAIESLLNQHWPEHKIQAYLPK